MDQSRFLERLKNPRETIVDGQDEAVVYDNAIGNVCVVPLDFQVEHGRHARDRFNGLYEVSSVPNVHRFSTQSNRPRGCGGIFRHVFRFETGCLTQPDCDFEQLSHEPFV